MATWSNALNKVTLDINQGGPIKLWEIKDHAIGADAEEVMEANIDLRGKAPLGYWELSWSILVSSGTGTPQIVVQWLNAANEVLAEDVLSSSPIRLFSQKVRLLVRETGSNTATYSAVIKLA